MKISRELTFLVSGLTILSSAGAANNTGKPNILVVLCDDLGYNDVSFNGSKDVKTPQLDKLAKNGAICTSAYVAHPFSGPSRASLMTGRYPQLIGTPYNLPEQGLEPNVGVPVNEAFMSNVLHDNGYFTAALGKWHLGSLPQFHPNSRGFDEFYGFLGGGHQYFADQYLKTYANYLKSGSKKYAGYFSPMIHNQELANESGYITDVLSNEAINIINTSAKGDKPFFMYLAYNAPHTPLEALDSDMKKFSSIKDKDRRTYAAMVYAVDRGVGKIVKALKANKQFDNTLIVFLSDNGGDFDHGACNFPLKGTKGDSWEGGFRVPMFWHWPAQIAPKTSIDYPISSLDLFPTFAKLANATLPAGKIVDGLDIMSVLKGEKRPSDDRMIYVFRHREGYNDVAARKGDWKITRMGNEPWQLYNITDDKCEKKNMSGRDPERLKSMIVEMQKWTKTHVKPLWVYSEKDQELWDAGILPDYNATFENEKLSLPPKEWQLKSQKK